MEATPSPEHAPEHAPELAAGLRLAVGRIARSLRQAHAVGDQTLSEVSVLARLDRDGPMSPSALAACERVRPQAMATTLAGLVDRGLVARAQDASDGRRMQISLTPDGLRFLSDRRSASLRRLAEAVDAALTPAEQEQLLDAIPLLERLAEQL
ncbi:MarR family winged helix-turn-helix transcriptional regulator [Streptacidiphilus fuscans]|uniref:MarR family transcriptional regulator n=1 Tax=Streptacidiphilus fuscans TaxID=2789292 RepID=A0A931B1T7_9ACTN|nr:MarR family transcriptional regulator [Streptacidiphilus fuscans]MBF9069625.1 MarR family transcriptional regulator [Streptacidiphilus fuscans]